MINVDGLINPGIVVIRRSIMLNNFVCSFVTNIRLFNKFVALLYFFYHFSNFDSHEHGQPVMDIVFF